MAAEAKPSLEFYGDFIEFVRRDIQGERKLANRRMFGVFLWCFVIPALTTFLYVLLIRFGIIPRRFGRYTDWFIVVFPVLYALQIISFDILHELPIAFRRGGIAATLGRALEEARWRDRVCRELQTQFVSTNRDNWPWLVKTFQTDLENLQHRTRYLTALAGAVFFLLMKGLDVFDISEPMRPGPYILGWFEASSSNAAQFVGLALFLVMLYLSGNQAYSSLARYLHCLELVQLELDQND
ncbi:MAG: hypothetical protein P4M08_12205 [Oligoflexia bacterium]|nr:hypothetical protein [Oligoflexia bacterium]